MTGSPLSTPAAQGTVAVRETAIAICERWLAAFADIEIEYTSARQYASDAVRDIIDQIREIDVSASPSPEALPASGVEVVRNELVQVLDQWKSRMCAGELAEVILASPVMRAALTSAPAPAVTPASITKEVQIMEHRHKPHSGEAAFTRPTSPYPGYINIIREGDEVTLRVRGDVRSDGSESPTVRLTMSKQEFYDFYSLVGSKI